MATRRAPGFFQRHPELTQVGLALSQTPHMSWPKVAEVLSNMAGEYISEKAVWAHIERVAKKAATSARSDAAPELPATLTEAVQAALAGHAPQVYAPPPAPPEPDPAQELEDAIALEKEELRRRGQLRLIKAMTTDEARFRRLLDTVQEALAIVPPPAWTPPPLPDANPDGDECHLALLISDTQVGITVDPLEVGETWAYDTGAFDERWGLLEAELYRLRDRVLRSGRRVTGLHLWFDGDLVENSTMRPKQRLDVDMSVALQATHLARQIESFVQRAVPLFPEIYVDVVVGNHGRAGKPGDDKSYDSWDYMVGVIVETAFRDHPTVHVKAWTQPWALLQVGASRILLNHGHGIKAWAGIPWYGIERKVARWQGLFREYFTYIMLGHFHNPASWDTGGGAEVIVNGAFFSGTSYSINDLALSTPAAQWAFVLSKDAGIVERIKIRLAPPSEAKPQAARNEWA